MTKETLIGMKNGNEESFRTIVMESQRPLFSFIFKFTADETVAKDLLQETSVCIKKTNVIFQSKLLLILKPLST